MPTLETFIWFIRNIMNISTSVLPDNSNNITYAFTQAQQICDLFFAAISMPGFNTAFNNLGGDILINTAIDVPNSTYFTDLRASFGINNFVAGVTAAASDESTSTTILNPNYAAMFTLMDLQNLKTPYGRMYLMYVQNTGTLWGLS